MPWDNILEPRSILISESASRKPRATCPRYGGSFVRSNKIVSRNRSSLARASRGDISRYDLWF